MLEGYLRQPYGGQQVRPVEARVLDADEGESWAQPFEH
jgi:hypothetical protein